MLPCYAPLLAGNETPRLAQGSDGKGHEAGGARANGRGRSERAPPAAAAFLASAQAQASSGGLRWRRGCDLKPRTTVAAAALEPSRTSPHAICFRPRPRGPGLLLTFLNRKDMPQQPSSTPFIALAVLFHFPRLDESSIALCCLSEYSAK